MELFGTVFKCFYFLIIATKNSILDVAGILDPILITDIFALRSWILMNLKSILASYRSRSISSNDKQDGWLLWDGIYKWFQIAWENSCALYEVLTFNQID